MFFLKTKKICDGLISSIKKKNSWKIFQRIWMGKRVEFYRIFLFLSGNNVNIHLLILFHKYKKYFEKQE